MGESQLGTDPSETQVADISAFLETVTGEIPGVECPVLPEATARTPLPDDM